MVSLGSVERLASPIMLSNFQFALSPAQHGNDPTPGQGKSSTAETWGPFLAYGEVEATKVQRPLEVSLSGVDSQEQAPWP